jgi:hypothetical protein
VSYINFSYDTKSDKKNDHVEFLDILQDSLILKKEIKKNGFIYQALCFQKTYEQIFLIYNEWDIHRIHSQRILDIEEEEYRNRERNNSHLRKHFNSFVRNNMDQEWTEKLFKMDDDNIMNWPTKFYNEIIKVFNFSDKNKDEKENENENENSNEHVEDSNDLKNNNNSNSENIPTDQFNSNNEIKSNATMNTNGKKMNEFNKRLTLEKLKEMEDYVHYQEKFSGNICKNKYYNCSGSEYFKLNIKNLICPISLEDKIKMKSNEINRKNKMNSNDSKSSNVISDNNDSKSSNIISNNNDSKGNNVINDDNDNDNTILNNNDNEIKEMNSKNIKNSNNSNNNYENSKNENKN